MLHRSQTAFLKRLFPGDQLALAPAETHPARVDASRRTGGPAWAVVRPRTTEEVSELLAWARDEGVPVTPRARGTGVAAGGIPGPEGGVVLSTLYMDRVLEISETDFVARVQPGVVTGKLQADLESRRLFYPPDPASVGVSTIGGNIATCAGGMRALKYGVTRDHVLGLEAVLPGGEVIRAGSRCHKDVCGLDLTRLLVGSEGSLAVITEAVLKLLPLPEASASLLAGFGDLERALAGAGAVFKAGLLPSALEFMDSGVLGALEKARAKSGGEVPWPKATGACLLFKLDGSRAAVGAEIERLREALADSAPTFVKLGTDQEGEEALWDLRRMISPAMHLVAPNKSNDDVAVPRGRVAEAVARYKAIGRERGVGVYCFGHLGDGNIHVDIMYDESDPAQAEAAPQAKKEILRASVEMGGTLTGEHGVGQVKTPYLGMQLGPAERGLMARVKAAFDPSGILNPGKAL